MEGLQFKWADVILKTSRRELFLFSSGKRAKIKVFNFMTSIVVCLKTLALGSH